MRCVQLKNGSKFAQAPLAKTKKEIQREREREGIGTRYPSVRVTGYSPGKL